MNCIDIFQLVRVKALIAVLLLSAGPLHSDIFDEPITADNVEQYVSWHLQGYSGPKLFADEDERRLIRMIRESGDLVLPIIRRKLLEEKVEDERLTSRLVGTVNLVKVTDNSEKIAIFAPIVDGSAGVPDSVLKDARKLAILGIGYFGEPGDVELLYPLLGHWDPIVREAAVGSFSKLGRPPEVLRFLRTLKEAQPLRLNPEKWSPEDIEEMQEDLELWKQDIDDLRDDAVQEIFSRNKERVAAMANARSASAADTGSKEIKSAVPQGPAPNREKPIADNENTVETEDSTAVPYRLRWLFALVAISAVAAFVWLMRRGG
ncbi:MAG: hypothetical protein OSB19_05910 [Opitutaceae bacterium]|nr:hypothetical protein [Opitutaceae bacterium]